MPRSRPTLVGAFVATAALLGSFLLGAAPATAAQAAPAVAPAVASSLLADAAPASLANATAAGVTPVNSLFTPRSGFNNWRCKPSNANPEPVVLLHGLGGQEVSNWFYQGPALALRGYCVYSTTYGEGIVGKVIGGLGDMRDSSVEVGEFVDKVLDSTGSAKVNLVGHSEGTTVGAYYIKFDGGRDVVKNFVGFGSNFKGTTLLGLNKLINYLVPRLPNTANFVDELCGACLQFIAPSDFLDDLNDGGITVPEVNYTSIVSKKDLIVTPYTSGALPEASNSRTIVLQDVCRSDISGHLAMAISPNITTLIDRALDPAQAARPMSCKLAIPAPL